MNQKQTRRQWLSRTATAAAALALTREGWTAAESRPAGPRIGMCDWSMGRQDPKAFELAKAAGLDGVEVSFGTVANKMWLRRDDIRKQYVDAAKATGLVIPSLAIGDLNNVPLMNEPRAAVWVADCIDVAAKLKIPTMLVPFFGKGELKERNAEDMRRVTEALVELAPRAELAGVTLVLESYLSAEAHLKILDAVKSPKVLVYYDVYNASHEGHDPIRELKLLGKDRICQIHFKDYPGLQGGKVDWPKVVATIKEIGYRGWIVLETPSPTKDVVADARTHAQYVRRLFA